MSDGGRLDGKVAVVTGGANGIGRACALRFAAEGADVVIGDVQADPGAAVVSAVERLGRRGRFVSIDASSRDDNEALAAVAEDLGGVDVLVTAAGISHANYDSGDIEADAKMMLGGLDYAERPGWDVVEADIDELRRVFEVNTVGTLLAIQACTARMLEAGKPGAIVTIASIAAKHPDAGPLAYTISKAGVWMLTKKAARMLAPAGIRVNAIGPGFIETNMTAVLDLAPEERKEQLWAQIPMARRGVPDEIASTALFLLSDDSSYMTGEILHPDGGFYTE